MHLLKNSKSILTKTVMVFFLPQRIICIIHASKNIFYYNRHSAQNSTSMYLGRVDIWRGYPYRHCQYKLLQSPTTSFLVSHFFFSSRSFSLSLLPPPSLSPSVITEHQNDGK
jgi:hypothetical protein